MVFKGTVESDFEKLIGIPDRRKSEFINFAATDFDSIRAALIQYIKTVYPTEYQNFSESDLGVMLIELVAYMGAVMSLKADMLANENYLRTVRNRNNLKKLLELIGVRLKGPTSASAQAKLELATSPAVGTTLLTVNENNRSLTVTSPTDGAPLNFTLYKTVNGVIEGLSESSARLQLDPAIDPVDSASAVYTNLALMEGSLVTMTGSFTTTDAIKRVPLSKSPVVQGSTQVYITDSVGDTGGPYTEVDNLFFASGSADKIFEVVYDDNFTANIVFGDGILGTTPSINATYLIVYRVGGGIRGNLPSDHINTQVSVNQNGGADITSTLENSEVATGGSDSETVEHAKKYAPLTFKRQDRIVTIDDYNAFANSYISPLGVVGKARAIVRKAFSSANVIDVYTLEKVNDIQLQRATPAFKVALLDAMDSKKMITDEVVIVDGLIRTLDLVITIRVDKYLDQFIEPIKLAARDKVLSFFNVDNFDFGKTLYLADLNRIIFELEEVVFSSVDNLDDDIKVDFNEIIQLNNLVINTVLV